MEYKKIGYVCVYRKSIYCELSFATLFSFFVWKQNTYNHHQKTNEAGQRSYFNSTCTKYIRFKTTFQSCRWPCHEHKPSNNYNNSYTNNYKIDFTQCKILWLHLGFFIRLFFYRHFQSVVFVYSFKYSTNDWSSCANNDLQQIW